VYILRSGHGGVVLFGTDGKTVVSFFVSVVFHQWQGNEVVPDGEAGIMAFLCHLSRTRPQ